MFWCLYHIFMFFISKPYASSPLLSLHTFRTHFVDTVAGVQYSTFRPFVARSRVARVVSDPAPAPQVVIEVSTEATSPVTTTVPCAMDHRHPSAQFAHPVGAAEKDPVAPSSFVVITIWPMPVPPPSPRHTPLRAATTSCMESAGGWGIGVTDACVGTAMGTGTGTACGYGWEYASALELWYGS